MRKFILIQCLSIILAFGQITQATESAGIECLGSYSNEVFSIEDTDPHVTGYAVDIFRQENRIFGRLSYTDGLVGEPLIDGVFQQNDYDPKTGRLSFSLSLNTDLQKNAQPLVLIFNGRLKGVGLKGTFAFAGDDHKQYDHLGGDVALIKDRLKYRTCPSNTEIKDFIGSQGMD